MAIRKHTISRTDNIYEMVPDLVRLEDGQLLCIYREADGHTVRRFSRLVLRSSWDAGASWSEKLVLVESLLDDLGVVLKWNCPRIQRLGDGRLLALCDVMPCPPDELTDLRNSHIVFWFSSDGGASWSEPLHTSVFGIMPDRVVELPSGTWLLLTQVYRQGDTYTGPQGQQTVVAHRSEDCGQTWQGPLTVAQDAERHYCEASTLLLPDGELVCYMRENSGRNLPGFKSFSQDEGRTWEGVYETPMSGCHRPVAGLLPSGRVLVTYRYRQAGSIGEFAPWRQSAETTWSNDFVSFWARNTFAYLESVDSAKARPLDQQGGVILPLDFDRSPRSDSGYTGWTIFPTGEIFCANYIVDDAPTAQIRGYRFDERDFCLVW